MCVEEAAKTTEGGRKKMKVCGVVKGLGYID